MGRRFRVAKYAVCVLAVIAASVGLGTSKAWAATASPTISSAFSPAVIAVGGTSTLTYTLTNPNTTQLTGVGFTDSEIDQFNLVALVGSTCDSAPELTGEGIVVTGVTLGAGASCTVSAVVEADTAGEFGDYTSDVTSNEGGTGGEAEATLDVVGPPSISESFSPASIPAGASTTLSFTIDNDESPPGPDLENVGFTDALPSGWVFTPQTAVVDSCGGTVAEPGGDSVSLTGGSIAPDDSCTVSVIVDPDAAGTYTDTTSDVTATYDAVSLTGGSASATLIVGETEVSVSASPNPATYGQSVTLTATLSPNDSGGTVGFEADGTAITGCTMLPAVQIPSGPVGTVQATCSTTALPAGTDTITAVWGGDPSYPIQSSGSTQLINTATTTLTYTGTTSLTTPTSLVPAAVLSSSYAGCETGQPVTFTLNADPLTGAAGAYTLESATTDSTGTATGAAISTAGWLAGNYTIAASYDGTPGTGECGPSTATMTVGDSGVSVSASPNPATYGQSVTLIATLSPSDGGGTVEFEADGSEIAGCGSQSLSAVGGNGEALCTTSALPAGTDTITVMYGGDPSYPIQNTGSTQLVNTAATTLTYTGTTSLTTPASLVPAAVLSSSYAGCETGQPVTFTLSANPLTGAAGAYTLESATTDSTGTATGAAISTTGWLAGSYTVIASYDGTPSTGECGTSTGGAGLAVATQAPTSLEYTGTTGLTTPASFVPAAVLSSSAAACETGQPVSFTLSADPLTGAAETYTLESATTDSTGTATGAAISTGGWLAGSYTITASYAGTADCVASEATGVLAVAVPGTAAAGAGSYTVAGAGTVGMGFVVGKLSRSNRYAGQLSVVEGKAWRFAGSVTSYTNSSTTAGTVGGTGTLWWWNPALNHGRGGWQQAATGVAYTAAFTASTKAAPASFGITIAYTPAAGQPTVLPNSGLVTLTEGGIWVAPLGAEKFF